MLSDYLVFPTLAHFPSRIPAEPCKDPVKQYRVEFDEAAVREIYRLTQGYPYFLQEWGYQAWNRAEISPISLAVVQDASATVAKRLDENFFPRSL